MSEKELTEEETMAKAQEEVMKKVFEQIDEQTLED